MVTACLILRSPNHLFELPELLFTLPTALFDHLHVIQALFSTERHNISIMLQAYSSAQHLCYKVMKQMHCYIFSWWFVHSLIQKFRSPLMLPGSGDWYREEQLSNKLGMPFSTLPGSVLRLSRWQSVSRVHMTRASGGSWRHATDTPSRRLLLWCVLFPCFGGCPCAGLRARACLVGGGVAGASLFFVTGLALNKTATVGPRSILLLPPRN